MSASLYLGSIPIGLGGGSEWPVEFASATGTAAVTLPNGVTFAKASTATAVSIAGGPMDIALATAQSTVSYQSGVGGTGVTSLATTTSTAYVSNVSGVVTKNDETYAFSAVASSNGVSVVWQRIA